LLALVPHREREIAHQSRQSRRAVAQGKRQGVQIDAPLRPVDPMRMTDDGQMDAIDLDLAAALACDRDWCRVRIAPWCCGEGPTTGLQHALQRSFAAFSRILA
jgi:hypothetical protein